MPKLKLLRCNSIMHFEIKLNLANIATLETDAIVNAANEQLLPGSGVCGAIHKAAGRELDIECRSIGYCKTGESVITNGYQLKAKKVIHTVGPVFWKDEISAPLLLKNCYLSSLKLADNNGLKSIAFPAISTGVYGYPIQEATQIAVDAVKSFRPTNSLKEVVFCCFSESDYLVYKSILAQAD